MSPQLAIGANSGIQDPSLPAWPTAFDGEGSHHHHARAKRPGRPRAEKITQGGSPPVVVKTRSSRSGSRSKPLGPRSDLIAAKISSANGRRRSPGHRQPAAHYRWRRREMDAAAPTCYRRQRTAPPPPPHHHPATTRHSPPPSSRCRAATRRRQSRRPPLPISTEPPPLTFVRSVFL